MRKIVAVAALVLVVLGALGAGFSPAVQARPSDPSVSEVRTPYVRYTPVGEFSADQLHALRVADEAALAEDPARQFAYLKASAPDVAAVKSLAEQFARAWENADYKKTGNYAVEPLLTEAALTEWRQSDSAAHVADWTHAFEVQRQLSKVSWHAIHVDAAMNTAVAIYDTENHYTHATDAFYQDLSFAKTAPSHQFFELVLRKQQGAWRVDSLLVEQDRDAREDRPDVFDRIGQAAPATSPVWTRFATMAPLGADEETRLHYLGDAKTRELTAPSYQVAYLTQSHPEVRAVTDLMDRAMHANFSIDYRRQNTLDYIKTMNGFFQQERWPAALAAQTVAGWQAEQRVQRVFHTEVGTITFNHDFTLASGTMFADVYIAHMLTSTRLQGETMRVERRFYLKKQANGAWKVVDWLPNEVQLRTNAPH